MEDSRYVINVDFLHEDGLLYVDTGALGWVCSSKDKGIGFRRAIYKRMNGFYKAFVKRGNVLTVEEILEEIGDGVVHYSDTVDYFKRLKKGFNSKKDKRGGNRINKKFFDGADLERATRNYKLRKRMYSFFEDRLDEGLVESMVSPRDVGKFIESQSKLSFADKALVSAALISGSGNGILSSDVPMMNSFFYGANKFGLDVFVCDAIGCKTRYCHKGNIYTLDEML